MTKNLNVCLLLVLAMGVVASGCEHMNGETTPQTQAAVEECPAANTKSDPDQVAHGGQGDSVKACMARIPCDATASQKMLAEHTCLAEEERRQGIIKVPVNRRDP